MPPPPDDSRGPGGGRGSSCGQLDASESATACGRTPQAIGETNTGADIVTSEVIEDMLTSLQEINCIFPNSPIPFPHTDPVLAFPSIIRTTLFLDLLLAFITTFSNSSQNSFLFVSLSFSWGA